MRVRHVVGMVAATLVALPLGMTGAGAAGQGAPDDRAGAAAAVSVLSGVQRADLEAMAADAGVGLDEAVARFAWQDAFSVAATAVQEAYPDSFATSEITSEDPAVGTIRFTGTVPAGARALVAALPRSVEVRLVGGESLSAADVDRAVIAAHRAVRATGRVGDAVSSYDRAAGLVRVAAAPARLLSPTSRAAEARAIRDALPASAGRVEVVLVDEVAGREEARNGGGRLESDGSSGLACTSGFNVVNSAGTTGIATAGHCPNGMTHENMSGETEVDLTFRSGHVGQWGDFQWHTSTDTEPDNFYWDSGDLRDVSARANPSDDQTICRYGRTTARECDTVDDLSTCVTVDGVEACRLVRMNSDEAEGGDSGGPWYSGNTAYGFHKGQTSCGFLWASTCDVWSRVTYIDDALGVTVRTS